MPHDLLPSFAQPACHEMHAAHGRRVETMMTSQKTDPNAQSQRRRDQEIDARYGEIGIAAVAAAARYQSIAPARPKAPRTPPDNDDRSVRAA